MSFIVLFPWLEWMDVNGKEKTYRPGNIQNIKNLYKLFQ